MIFDLQVKHIDFWFSSKSGASRIILFENITFNGRMWCFLTGSGILNVTAVILLYAKRIFSAQFLRMELSTVARLIYQILLNLQAHLHNLGLIRKENECSLQVCVKINISRKVSIWLILEGRVTYWYFSWTSLSSSFELTFSCWGVFCLITRLWVFIAEFLRALSELVRSKRIHASIIQFWWGKTMGMRYQMLSPISSLIVVRLSVISPRISPSIFRDFSPPC